MSKKILFVLALSWILVGCADQMHQMAGGVSGTLACTAYSGTIGDCEGPKNDPKVTLDLDAMTVDPECVNAKKGRVIIFDLVSASEIEKGSVEIFPKYAVDDWWLAGTNSPNKKRILILPPKKKNDGSAYPADEYQYSIRTTSWCLDPRINVTN